MSHPGETFGSRFDRDYLSVTIPSSPPTGGPSEPFRLWFSQSFLPPLFYALACVVFVLAAAGSLLSLASAASSGWVQGRDWLVFGTLLLSGLAVSGLLVGAGMMLWLIGHGRRQMVDHVTRLSNLAARSDQEQFDAVSTRLEQVEQLLRQVSRDALLDESARLDRRRQIARQEFESLLRQVRDEMGSGQWDKAAAALTALRAEFPHETEEFTRLRDELDRRRMQAEDEDIASARQYAEELMSVSAWGKALQVVQDLVAKHPDATAAKSLLSRVEREHKMALEQQRGALYLQIQKATARRDWKEALASADRMVSQFPNAIEAEAVRAQMETLRANAEIQHRQSVENTIKDLVRRRRFAEAVRSAEELVTAYPGSPQAAALKDQLPRLRELAAKG